MRKANIFWHQILPFVSKWLFLIIAKEDSEEKKGEHFFFNISVKNAFIIKCNITKRGYAVNL